MFRGIDPDGLVELAETLRASDNEVRHQVRRSLAILRRSHPPHPTQDIELTGAALGLWASDNARTLVWRAEAIRSGQQEGLNLISVLRAEFAATTPFSLDTFEESLRQWIADAEERRRHSDGAIAAITRWLDQRLTDWDVSNRDLHNIEASLRSLSPVELNLVIKGLSQSQLHRWIEEMGYSFNGYSQGEKQQLFTYLATTAGGEALGKIHEAILSAGTVEATVDFGRAIQLFSSDRVITDFVEYAVRQDLSGHMFSTIAPSLALSGIEDRKQLDSSLKVMLNTEGVLLTLVADSAAVADDPALDPLGQVISHLVTSDDHVLKADSFLSMHGLAATGSQQLADLLISRGSTTAPPGSDDKNAQRAAQEALTSETTAALLRWCTEVLASDADAIVTLLASELDPLGDATADYFYQLVSTGDGQQLNQVVNALRGGVTVDLSKFEEPGVDHEYPFPHAQNLGYVAGALNRGVQMCADDAHDDIDAITAIAGVVMFALDLPLKAGINAADWATGLVGKGLDFTLSTSASTTQDDIERYTYNVIRAIEIGLRPSSPVDDTTEVKLKAIQLWDDQYLAARDRYYYPDS